MDYYGLLFLYYLKGLSGKSILRLFFNIEAGGTEEILPNALLNGSVDLGSLDWSYTDGVFFSSESVGKTQTANAQPTIFCIPFVAKPVDYNGAYSGEDKVIWQHPNASLRVRDSAYTSPAEFKSAMQGVTLWYEKEVSTPSTTPILADIQYPDGLRTDQYFTYRETPTTVSNKARIKTIKGNTLVWNQLLRNGNFVSASGWAGRQSTITVANNVATITPESDGSERGLTQVAWQLKANHKYLLSIEVNPPVNGTVRTSFGGASAQGFDTVCNGNVWNKCQGIVSILEDMSRGFYSILRATITTSQTIQYRNAQVFDLTQMFDAGNEPTTVEEFTSLFPLPYYDYNAGTMLSFNGTGIKTVGKNLLMPSTVTWSDVSYVDGYYNINATIGSTAERRLFGDWGIQNAVSLGLTSGTYIWTAERLGINTPAVSVRVSVHGTESYVNWSGGTSRYINSDDKFFILLYFGSAGTYNGKVGIQLEFGSNATSYEPYTESVINLPISTYFPNGMKSAGIVYDELTATKATTRIGAVDLGSLTWTKVGAISMFYATYNTDGVFHIGTELPNIKNILYDVCSAITMYNNRNGIVTDDVITVNAPFLSSTEQRIVIADTSFTDATALKTALSGVYLYYELATPTETPITTEDANEALSLLMGKSVSSNNANQMINIITKGE